MYCARVYEKLGNDVIFPLVEILGIDNKKDKSCHKRIWEGSREVYAEIIPQLKNTRIILKTDKSGENHLHSAVLTEVVETIERQPSHMRYFNQSGSQAKMDNEKLKHSLENLGAESQFAKLENRIAVCRGLASVLSYSRRNVIATNRLLVDTEVTEKYEAEERWK